MSHKANAIKQICIILSFNLHKLFFFNPKGSYTPFFSWKIINMLLQCLPIIYQFYPVIKKSYVSFVNLQWINKHRYDRFGDIKCMDLTGNITTWRVYYTFLLRLTSQESSQKHTFCERGPSSFTVVCVFDPDVRDYNSNPVHTNRMSRPASWVVPCVHLPRPDPSLNAVSLTWYWFWWNFATDRFREPLFHTQQKNDRSRKKMALVME